MPCAKHAKNKQYSANFNNANIRQFVKIVSQHLSKTILINPSVQKTISVRSNNTFSQQKYYQFFLSILNLYSYSVITLNNSFLKVVRSANVKTSPKIIANSSRPSVSNKLVTQIVPLKNVPARNLAPLLRQIINASSVSNVVHYKPSNVLILTSRASTINKLIKVIKRVNVISTKKQQIIHLKVSSVNSSSNSTLGPTFNTRTIQNAVLVKTSKTVVLSKLLNNFSKKQVSKVPLLSNIPLVKQLFRYTSTKRAKRNLIVFIRPTIIRNNNVYRSLSKKKYTRYRQKQQQQINKKSKALVSSKNLPVLNKNTFNSHAPAPSSR